MRTEIRAYLLFVAILWGLALTAASIGHASSCTDSGYLDSLDRANKIVYQASRSTVPFTTSALYADAWRQISHAPDACNPVLVRSKTYLTKAYFSWFTSYSYVYRGENKLALIWANRGLYWQRLADRTLGEAGVV